MQLAEYEVILQIGNPEKENSVHKFTFPNIQCSMAHSPLNEKSPFFDKADEKHKNSYNHFVAQRWNCHCSSGSYNSSIKATNRSCFSSNVEA